MSVDELLLEGSPLVVTAGLAIAAVSLHTAGDRRRFLPCIFIAIGSCMFAMVDANRSLAVGNKAGVLIVMGIALILRGGPDAKTAPFLWVMGATGIAGAGHNYFIAAAIALFGSALLRTAIWYSRQREETSNERRTHRSL